MDRNAAFYDYCDENMPSSPARGTWIEIKIVGKEVVISESSPARGTWIEIDDENAASALNPGRPPQGGRG